MKKRLESIIITLIVLGIGAFTLFPVIYMAVKSVSGESTLTFRQYKALFSDGGVYFFMFIRSYLVAIAVTAGQTFVSVAVGFLLGRFRFRGKMMIIALYTLVLFLPYSATLLPNYMIIRGMNLLDTQLSIILPAIFSPLGVIIMTIFVSSVPDETLDAALLETNKLSEILRYIVIPQIIPGITLTMVITFTEAWNMVEQPQAMMENRLLHPLSVSLNSIFSGGDVNFAGSFLYIIPPILLLWSCRDSLREGILKNVRSGLGKGRADG